MAAGALPPCHRRHILALYLFLLAALCWLLALASATASSPATAPVVVHLLAALEPPAVPQLARILQKAINDVHSDARYEFEMQASPLSVGSTPGDTMKALCRTLETGNVSALVVLADRASAFAAATVSGFSALPVVGATEGLQEHAFKDLSPFYVGVNPSLEHLAEALMHVLEANHWYTSTLLADDTPSSMRLRHKLLALASHRPWTQVVPLTVPRGATHDQAFSVLSHATRLRSRVVVLYCDAHQARLVFQEAARLNMVSGDWIWLLILDSAPGEQLGSSEDEHLPLGLLALQMRPLQMTKHVLRASVRLIAMGLRQVGTALISQDGFSCWFPPSAQLRNFSLALSQEMQRLTGEIIAGRQTFDGGGEKIEGVLNAHFDILNFRLDNFGRSHWHPVGNVTGGEVHFDAVAWPGNLIIGPHPTANSLLRVVTAFSPPFVMESSLVDNQTCLKGVPCLQVHTNNSSDLAALAADYLAGRGRGIGYNLTCCFGLSVDLLENVARELRFDYVLYLVADRRFGGRRRTGSWNGIVADLLSGAAHMAFAPLSVTSPRAECIDFSVPYFYSGVSFLASTKKPDVPLLGFLVPFSPFLWIAIFASLNATAIAAAIYEWLSPFGLNPWGRQRTKNFSIASALWVMWSLLFSHLVAFKAPKSWPNKVLINLWGCFSVIFLASYTANIAKLFAGFYFPYYVDFDAFDRKLLEKKVGTTRSSSAETYISERSPNLWQHMLKHSFRDIEEGIHKVRSGELDLLIGDTTILDYYRASDPGSLRVLSKINDDSYAVGLPKGSPLKDPISVLITRLNENGYLDYLSSKWFGSLPYNRLEVNPMQLSIGTVAGVFIMLGVGILVGVLILVFEHLVFKHALPRLRRMPKGTVWRSPNLMFLSQKLYRFINCVELVSPHHSAKELVNNLRTGQITSLFQKSVKRKEHEQRRRRKSKAQFFEMIQEIRRVQKETRGNLVLGGKEALGVKTVIETPVEVSKEHQRPIRDEGRWAGAHPSCARTDCPSTAQPAYFSDDSCSRLILRAPSPLDLEDDDDDPSDNSDSDCEPARFSPISTSLNDLSPYGIEAAEDAARSMRHSQGRVRSVDDLNRLASSVSVVSPPQAAMSMQCNSLVRNSMVMSAAELPSVQLDERRLQRLTKDDIVLLWQSSERHLRQRLRQALVEKQELEARLSVFQRALLQPP